MSDLRTTVAEQLCILIQPLGRTPLVDRFPLRNNLVHVTRRPRSRSYCSSKSFRTLSLLEVCRQSQQVYLHTVVTILQIFILRARITFEQCKYNFWASDFLPLPRGFHYVCSTFLQTRFSRTSDFFYFFRVSYFFD